MMRRVPLFPEALQVQALVDWYQGQLIRQHNISCDHALTVGSIRMIVRDKTLTSDDKIKAISDALADDDRRHTWWNTQPPSPLAPHVTLYRLEER